MRPDSAPNSATSTAYSAFAGAATQHAHFRVQLVAGDQRVIRAAQEVLDLISEIRVGVDSSDEVHELARQSDARLTRFVTQASEQILAPLTAATVDTVPKDDT